MALAARPVVTESCRRFGDFDVIDGHFLYPDGVAAVLLGRWFGKPVVLSARGSDANIAARERVAGACVRWAARRAAAVIAVSEALRESLDSCGVPRAAITVLRNGVDPQMFGQRDRDSARLELGIAGPTLLCVGNLVPEKGHALVIEALARLPGVHLIAIGSGPQGAILRAAAARAGVADRVSWLAPVPQESLANYYVAADVTVLASTREGMPNVLLESLACGTPVVATAVGGSVEIVANDAAGRLVFDRSADAFAAACRALLAAPPDRSETVAYARRFGWAEPVAGQIALLRQVLVGRSSAAGEPLRGVH